MKGAGKAQSSETLFTFPPFPFSPLLIGFPAMIWNLKPLLLLALALPAWLGPGAAHAETETAKQKAGEIPPGPLSGLVVALDVGHSLSNGGAKSATGRLEYEYNADTARVLREVLQAAGARVMIINETGTLTGLWDRPQRAQRLGADVFISIHHDSVNDRYIEKWTPPGSSQEQEYCDKFRGYSVFCSRKNFMARKSRTVALQIGAAMRRQGFVPTLHHAEKIPGENRPLIDRETGVYEFTDLVVAKAGRLPSVLLECGVIVHREEEQEVRKRSYQERIGAALIEALVACRAKKVFR
jgi:N-acetylmuramoyl-L-alanine amidase